MAEVGDEQRAGAMREQAREEEINKSGEENPSYKTPAMVFFPYDARRRASSLAEPLKMENEEFIQEKRTSNVWQLYAVGAFLILRWAWVGWKKRKNAGDPGEDAST